MLPKNMAQMGNLIHSCIDLSEYEEGATLKQIIMREKGAENLSIDVVKDWLQGLPTACTVPFESYQIRQILDSTGNSHWDENNYWRWAADRVLSFAMYPEAYA